MFEVVVIFPKSTPTGIHWACSLTQEWAKKQDRIKMVNLIIKKAGVFFTLWYSETRVNTFLLIVANAKHSQKINLNFLFVKSTQKFCYGWLPLNVDIIGFCIDLNVRETNHHAISVGGLQGHCIKKMTSTTTIFSAINTAWKQISVENQKVHIHPNCHQSLPSGLMEIYFQVVLILKVLLPWNGKQP